MRKKTFFYGWIIVLACLLIQAVPYSLVANILPTFTNFVISGEGFTYTEFAFLFTLGTFVSALCSPFIGKLYSRPNPNIKRLYTVGCLLVGIGFAAMSLAGKNIIVYYALSILLQIGVSIVSAIGVPMLINSWFVENKGTAMGIAFCGRGLGNVILQQLASKWLSNPSIGYKGAFLRFGFMALIISLPIALFVMRLPRSKKELQHTPLIHPKKQLIHDANWGYSFSDVQKIKSFWVFALSFTFIGLYVGGMSIEFIPYLQTLEKTGAFTLGSALVASLFGFFSIFGNLSGGYLFDKLGIKKSLILAGILVVTCGLSLIFVPTFNFLGIIFSICLGISMFSYIIGPSYMTGALFGNREFGTILSVVQIFFAIGFGLGSTLFGIVVDKHGFPVAWISTIIYAIIAYSGLLYSTTAIIKLNKEANVIETKKIS